MTKLLTDEELSGIYKKAHYYPHMLCNYERAIEAAVIAKMLALIGKPVLAIGDQQDPVLSLYKLPKELK